MFASLVLSVTLAGEARTAPILVVDAYREAYAHVGAEFPAQPAESGVSSSEVGSFSAAVQEPAYWLSGQGSMAAASQSSSIAAGRLEVTGRASVVEEGGGAAAGVQASSQYRVDLQVSGPTAYLAVGAFDMGPQLGGFTSNTGISVQLWQPSLGTGAFGYTGPYEGFQSFSTSGTLAAGTYRFSVVGNAFSSFGSDLILNEIGFAPSFEMSFQSSLAFGSNLDALLGGAGTVGGLEILYDTAGAVSFNAVYSALAEAEFQVWLAGAPERAPSFQIPGSSHQLWEIEASGTVEGETTVALHYDASLIGVPESMLAVYHFDGTSWERLPGIVDAVNDRIVVRTSGFSPFMLGVPEPAPGILLGTALAALGLRAAPWRSRRRAGRFRPTARRRGHGG